MGRIMRRTGVATGVRTGDKADENQDGDKQNKRCRFLRSLITNRHIHHNAIVERIEAGHVTILSRD